MIKRSLLEIIVTARPSWARVKSLASHYLDIAGSDNLRITFIGPAVSDRYGNVSTGLSKMVNSYKFHSLQESSNLEGVALTCVDSAKSIINHWANERPDCALIIADRTETLGIAMSASIMQIPLIHLQGGEISGSIDDKIRDANSKLADLHLTTNKFTKDRLIGLGEEESRIHVIGCPSIDLVKEVKFTTKPLIDWSNSNSNLLGGVGANFTLSDPFGIIMFHPDTLNTLESNFWIEKILSTVETSNINWLWFWPNPDYGSDLIAKKIRSSREKFEFNNVRFLVNLEPELFIELTLRSKVIVGNSSYGVREASYIGLKAINLGNRQNGRQRGLNVIDIDINSVDHQDFNDLILSDRIPGSNLYGDGDAGRKGAEIIYNWAPSIKMRI